MSLWAIAWVSPDGRGELAEALAAVDKAVGTFEALAVRSHDVFVSSLRGAYRSLTVVHDGLGSYGADRHIVSSTPKDAMPEARCGEFARAWA